MKPVIDMSQAVLPSAVLESMYNHLRTCPEFKYYVNDRTQKVRSRFYNTFPKIPSEFMDHVTECIEHELIMNYMIQMVTWFEDQKAPNGRGKVRGAVLQWGPTDEQKMNDAP